MKRGRVVVLPIALLLAGRAWSADLSDAELWTRPYPYGNSVGHLLLHITGNLNYYIGTQIAGTGYVRDRPREFGEMNGPSRTALLAALAEAVAMVKATIAAQTQESWSAPYEAVGSDETTRFGIVLRLEFYTPDDLRVIVERSAEILAIPIDRAGANEIAGRARGTPRIANRLLRRVRDYAQVKADGRITAPVANAALEMLEVDQYGFDEADRKLLLTIIEKYNGGPVGVNSLAVAVGEEPDTIEEVYEPYLIMEGYLNRTAQGRVLTAKGYHAVGLKGPSDPQQALL